jgi:DNA invertase Pin-like site-specific DNA recombinase
MNALNWAAEAKKKREVQTGQRVVTLVEGLNLSHMGSLRSTFSNIPRRTKTLVSRCYRGLYEGAKRASAPPVKDARGPLVRRIETAQTFLTASEVDRLIEDYNAGMSVRGLATKYGIHRATVSAHLSRRNTPRHRPGLDVDEQAEVVRLFRAGVSMRAISRRLGVGRKPVRACLVDVGLMADEPTASKTAGHVAGPGSEPVTAS